MKNSPVVLAIVLCVSLPACDRQGEADPPPKLLQTEQRKSSEAERTGWGPALLSLVPERGDDTTPSLATIRDAFKECGLKKHGPLVGRCDLSGVSPASPSALSVGIEIEASGDEARAIRLSACCSADENFFRPIEEESVIRTELICPELTIVSSETVKAFRVSSTGKRDFIYAKGTRTSAAGGRVDLTLLLSPIDRSDECLSLRAAHAGSNE